MFSGIIDTTPHMDWKRLYNLRIDIIEHPCYGVMVRKVYGHYRWNSLLFLLGTN